MSSLFTIEINRFAYDGAVMGILEGFHLEIKEGEIVGLMGPNGCGKSTLLQIIAGDLPLQGGHMQSRLNSGDISFIYQDYRRSLFPWMTAHENIRLPLRIRGGNRAAARLIDELTKEFGLGYDLNKLPRLLSGGEQQKICVLRALVESPRLLLMDEVCSAMDYGSRLHFLSTLRKRLLSTATSALMVSHSAEETLLFADRIVLLDQGGGTPVELRECQREEAYLDHINAIHAHFLD